MVRGIKAERGRFRATGVAIGLLLIVACASVVWQPRGSRRTAPVPGAQVVGQEECRVCHEDVSGHEAMASYHANCETCHGGGSLHVDSEAVADIRNPASGDCLSCHTPGRDSHLQWGVGQHSQAGLLCSDCHDPHNQNRQYLRSSPRSAFPDMDTTSQLCVECHADVGTRFRYPTHHPVAEGGMACVNCHDPHEDARVRPGDQNQLCAGCHQDIMGPWIYEHPPATEDCQICHDPHGAVTSDLLVTVQPVICISCHSVNDQFHQLVVGPGLIGNAGITQDFPTLPSQQIKPFETGQKNQAGTYLRRCTDCHGAVHGSYTDEHLRH